MTTGKKSEVFNFKPIASKISRNRYFEITRYLHFCDNETLPARGEQRYDRLGKVRTIFEMLKTRCRVLYNPHQQISIDEAMVPYKGRSSLKQYMPKKPVKRGFKVWMRADAVNGYVCEMDVYTGK